MAIAFWLRQIDQRFSLLCSVFSQKEDLGSVDPFGIRMSLKDACDVTGIKKDQGSDGKNTNQAHEDLQEDGVKMNSALFLHDRQGLLQGERDLLINARGGHGIIGIQDLEDPSKEARLFFFLKNGISGTVYF